MSGHESIYGLYRHRAGAGIMLLFLLLSAASCGPQISSKVDHRPLSLSGAELKAGGIAFITPSTVTGQEEEKQSAAFIFASTLRRERPDLRIIPLPQTLSSINRAGLADVYHEMYKDYRDTGIFSRDTLTLVGRATSARYLAQLKLAGFDQLSTERFGIFGLRLVQTKSAAIRLFFQLWDARSGDIVWEAIQEMNWAQDTFRENPITLQNVLERAAREVVDRLPR